MLKEQNELLTHVGKDTPMGTVMRRYWHPIATSAELPEPDGDPIVRKLLGEKFVLFRDTHGRVGILDELCLHRGASMALGRVEEGGIRCIYHGWKFDVAGTLLETPNHADPRVKERLKAQAYPVREQSGLIWAYTGPKDKQPPFRRFAFDSVPASNRRIVRVNVRANYLQLWEGGTDSSHVGILHSNVTRPGWLSKDSGKVDEFAVKDMMSDKWDDMAPKLEIENTSFGYHYVGIRKLDGASKLNVRLTPVFMPTGRIIIHPNFFGTVFETPMDDNSTATFIVDASTVKPLDLGERIKRSGLSEERIYKDLSFVATAEDGFFQDRQSMREKRNWTGFQGLTQEDFVVSVSMGPIYDRSGEHLVAADAGVVRLRQRLLRCVELSEAGKNPLGLDIEDMSKMQGFDEDISPQHPGEISLGHMPNITLLQTRQAYTLALQHANTLSPHQGDSMNKDLFDAGLKTQRKVLSAEYGDASIRSADGFNMGRQEHVTQYCWGDIWNRRGLDRKTRSFLNLAMITALNRPHDLKLHVRGAINNGLTKDELKEVFLQTAICCGVPAALDSFRTAKEVFKEMRI